MKVVIAGGGTAGHVTPALAIARALEGDEVVFFGTEHGAEARLVPAAGWTLETLGVRGLDRSRPWTAASVGGRAIGAIGTAVRLLRRHRPRVVLGMGGYVSLPVCLAAYGLRIPVVIHEQNAVFGLSNRVCKPLARWIAVSFEQTLAAAGAKGVHTGNPIAAQIAAFDRAAMRPAALDRYGLDAERKTLLVFGGSQGARRINEAAVGLASRWRDHPAVQIVHVTGPAHQEEISERVAAANNGRYRVVGYVDGMQEPYALADVTVCRGGATTVAELCVVGQPAVIVPYPHHRDRQQELHARVLEGAGAAIVVRDEELTSERLDREATRMLGDDDLRASMGAAARTLARPDAAERVAALLREVA